VGIGDFIRGQFIDIVEWVDTSRDTIAYKFDRHQNEIKNGAQLVVREGQVAIFENEGQVADVFLPGTYSLTTANLPILSDLKGWKYGFESPFKAEVFFFNTRQFTDFKWGTQNPVMMRDPEFGPIRLRAFGTYALRVSDPATLLRQLIGTNPTFSTADIAEYLRQNVVSRQAPALATSGVAALDLAAHQTTIADQLATALTAELAGFGVEIVTFVIENISFPPEVEEALDKRTSMGVVGNLNAYTQYEAATALGDAANNPGGGGGLLNAGVGIGVGSAIGQQMASQLGQLGQPSAGAATPPPLPGAVAVFASINGAQAGPFDVEGLTARVAAGEITAETLVWQQGMAEWTPAAQVPAVAALLGQAPPPLPAQS
jgi:membrane protease subunit (stomatin/prohibitin family)